MIDTPHKITISIIVAVAQNGIIGRDGDMPWRLSSDLKRFKKTTMGCPIIMGRKTYQSIGKPLPGRKNIVISRNNFAQEGITGASTIETAIKIAEETAKENGHEEIFIIGGGQIYFESLDLADKLYVTHVEAEIDGDTSFPAIDSSIWEVTHEEEIPSGEKDSHATRFVIYRRKAA